MDPNLALTYWNGGLTIIPIAPSGLKQSLIKWGKYQKQRPTVEEIKKWFPPENDNGAAVILGPISDNLYALDFDDCDEQTFKEWSQRVEYEANLSNLGGCSVVKSPRGWHVYFRHKNPMKRLILAKKSKDETLIELRAEGGYIILPGSPPECHPDSKIYELKWGEEIQKAPEIDEVALQAFFLAARSLNSYTPSEARYTGVQSLPAGDARPGTYYCLQAGEKEWKRLLEKAGWTFLKQKDGYWLLCRPGKEQGISATLGFCKTDLGQELYVFTTNAEPFKPDACYSLFSTRAILEFNGDFKKCAKECIKEGYGVPAPDELTETVTKIVEKLKPLSEKRKFLLEETTLNTWREVDKKFARTFDLKREKEFQGDPDSYTNSLLIWCKKYFKDEKNYTDADYWINFGLKCLHDFYKKHNFDQRAFDINYISQKIYSVLRYQYKADEQIYQDIQDAEIGSEPDIVLQWIRKTVNLPIKRYYMSAEGDGALHWFVLDDGKKIDIGSTEILRNANKFESQLFNYDLQHWDFAGTLDKAIKAPANYPNLIRQLYKIRKTTDETKNDIIDWISEFFCRLGLAREEEEDGIKQGVDRRRALYQKGCVWVNLERLRKWVQDWYEEKISIQKLGQLIRAINPDEVKKTRHRGVSRKNPVYYWGIPEKYFDPEILKNEIEQNV